MSKEELEYELEHNMDLTKEQFIATCELIEELGLIKIEER